MPSFDSRSIKGLVELDKSRKIIYSLFVFSILLAIYFTVTSGVFPNFRFQLGSVNHPTQGILAFWSWISLWLSFISLFLAFAIYQFSGDLIAYLNKVNNSRLLLAIFLVSLLFSLFVKFFVLQTMWLTDDESAYLFAAQAIASGKLWVQSPENKEFFDRIFMINDGRLMPQYFYGWPFILAIAVKLNIVNFINSLLFALSNVVLFKVASLNMSRVMASLVSLVFLLAPLSLVGSATLLSHGSCTLFVLCAWYCYSVIDKKNISNNLLLFFVLFSGVVLFIRPYTAFLILIAPSCHIFLKLIRYKSFKAWLFFLVPSVVSVLIFLYLNKVLHGAVLDTGYSHYMRYADDNNYIYSFWNYSPNAVDLNVGKFKPEFNFFIFIHSFFSGLQRLSFDGLLLFSPFLLLFIIIISVFTYPILAVSAVMVILGHALWYDLGVDSFGPVHLTESIPLLLILSFSIIYKVILIYNLNVLKNAIFSVLLALIVTFFWGNSSIRIYQNYQMANNINLTYKYSQNINNAIIFVGSNYSNQTPIYPLRHFRFWRENPNPFFSNNILWLNDLEYSSEELKHKFIGRDLFKMAWDYEKNVPVFLRLNDE